jgi:hypothetical protein
MMMVDGRVLLDDGHAVDLDEAELLARAQAAARRLVEQLT